MLISGFIVLILNCCKKDEYQNLNCLPMPVTYTSAIKAIIDANCISSGCHNSGSPHGNYTTYDGVLIRANNGTLSKRVLYTKDMPKNSTLTLDDRKKIKCWIDSGAPKN